MTRPEPDEDCKRGFYSKYQVERIGGTPGKHDDCLMFVLDLNHDPWALCALRGYATACRPTYPILAQDLDRIVNAKKGTVR